MRVNVNGFRSIYATTPRADLNPNEMLNANLKANVTKQALARTKGHLKKAVISHLRRLQKSPQRVVHY
ncbi:MAG: hypothetical protein V3Q69_00385 [Burkholderia sp.]